MRYADRTGPSRTRLCRDGCSPRPPLSLSTSCIDAKYQSSDEDSGVQIQNGQPPYDAPEDSKDISPNS